MRARIYDENKAASRHANDMELKLTTDHSSHSDRDTKIQRLRKDKATAESEIEMQIAKLADAEKELEELESKMKALEADNVKGGKMSDLKSKLMNKKADVAVLKKYKVSKEKKLKKIQAKIDESSDKA